MSVFAVVVCQFLGGLAVVCQFLGVSYSVSVCRGVAVGGWL